MTSQISKLKCVIKCIVCVPRNQWHHISSWSVSYISCVTYSLLQYHILCNTLIALLPDPSHITRQYLLLSPMPPRTPFPVSSHVYYLCFCLLSGQVRTCTTVDQELCVSQMISSCMHASCQGICWGIMNNGWVHPVFPTEGYIKRT